jgi:di/tricarboxylate transporter
MEIALVLLILAGTVTLFVTERFSSDLVAWIALAAVLVVAVVGPAIGWVRPDRWVSVPEALSGFANPAVLTVGAMFVLSAGLQRTGAMAAVGRAFARVGKRRLLLSLVVMLTAGLVSAFVNNTAAVAVFLPLVLAACERNKISPSRLLIPLSYAAQFGGVCTLIGTSTNLLVNSIAREAGYSGFTMFEFSRLGLILMGVGSLYLLLFGRWLLPERRGAELTEVYKLREYITELRVTEKSPLIGKTLKASRLGEKLDATVLEIHRGEEKIWSPLHEPLRAGDILLVRGNIQALMRLRAQSGLELEPEFKLRDETLESQDLVLVEALVAPRSRLVGRTIAEMDFRWRFGGIVLALQREGHLLQEKLSAVRLRFGDALLLLARKEEVNRLRANDNLIILGEVEEPTLRGRRALTALAILGAVVALASLKIVPILVSAWLGCLAMIFTRCLTPDEAYEAVDWRVIFLLAGVLPLGLALERSGAATLLAGHVLGVVGKLGPVAALAALYLLTATLTEFMSNNAAAVLLAPVAISTAVKLGVDPKPLLLAVTFAASTSFATPVGYQTNTMIYNAGGYRFTDFLRVGIPLNLIFWVLAIVYIPRYWPF